MHNIQIVNSDQLHIVEQASLKQIILMPNFGVKLDIRLV